jgi:Tfp pilus assembly pilus retraction ATPase PilT
MYSMDDLLLLINSEGANELRLHAGAPPVIVVRGEQHTIDGPPITTENAGQLLQSVANTRQKRVLGHGGAVQFILRRSCSKRNRMLNDFLVCAKMEDEHVGIDIHRRWGGQM